MAEELRLVSWNVDGIERFLGLGLAELHTQLGSPHILALQEIRIRAKDSALIAKLESALPGYVCSHSLCADPINVRFRGGRAYGVATFVRADLDPHWLERATWDREGRLVALELAKLNLLVANVYAVNGTDKPYFDPETGAVKGDRHEFKRKFQHGLLDYFQAASARGLKLILLGDWNVSRTQLDVYPRLRKEIPHATARAMLNEVFMPALAVEDVFRVLNPEARAYTWFSRVAAKYGRLDAARVDYALVSNSLLSSITGATIRQDEVFELGSDHAPVMLGIRA